MYVCNVCMYVMYGCMYVCVYVGMYACMYACMYLCMHVCIGTELGLRAQGPKGLRAEGLKTNSGALDPLE